MNPLRPFYGFMRTGLNGGLSEGKETKRIPLNRFIPLKEGSEKELQNVEQKARDKILKLTSPREDLRLSPGSYNRVFPGLVVPNESSHHL